MNTLRLSRYLFSRYLIRELVVIFQLVLMLLYASAILQPVDSLAYSRTMLHRALPLDFSQTLFFNPSGALLEATIWELTETPSSFRIAETASSVPGVAQVLQTAEDTAYFEKSIGIGLDGQEMTGRVKTSLITYSQGFLSNCRLDFAQGGLSDVWEGDACPVVVSAALAEDLPVGTRTELTIGREEIRAACVVTGVLEEDVVVPVVNFYTADPSPETLGLDTTASGAEEVRLILAQYDPRFFQDPTWIPGALILPEAGIGTEDLQHDLTGAVGNMGSIVLLSQVELEAMQSVLYANYELIPTILLALLACFGYGGYLFLHVRQRRKEFAVFSILGMTRRRIVWLNLVSGLALLLVSFGLARLLRPWFLSEIIQETSPWHASLVSSLFSLTLLAGALLLSLLAGLQQSRTLSTAAQYRGGD